MKRAPMPRNPAGTRAWQNRSRDAARSRAATDHTPRKRLPARSAKRLAEEEARAELRARVHARDKVCQALGVLPGHTCAGPMDVDEIIPRSAWPGGHLVDENCQLLCRRAHDWKGEHPDDAHALGLHGYSWERPRG